MSDFDGDESGPIPLTPVQWYFRQLTILWSLTVAIGNSNLRDAKRIWRVP